MKLNTNSNTYIIIYAVVMVVIVAFLLAFVSKALQPMSEANEAIDKKSQILAALNLRNIAADQVEKRYAEVIEADLIVTKDGQIIKDGQKKDQDAFKMQSKDITPKALPLYICTINNEKKYVVPVYGLGLWGSLWGYIALEADGQRIYGAYFSHQSETAGLGSLISEQPFQEQFKGKKVYDENGVVLSVVKKGKAVKDLEPQSRCDAVTGATLTSDGVDKMLKESLKNYQTVFKNL